MGARAGLRSTRDAAAQFVCVEDGPATNPNSLESMEPSTPLHSQAFPFVRKIRDDSYCVEMIAKHHHLSLANITPQHQETLHAAPLRVKDVGAGLLVVQEPLKPIEVEAPGASELL